MRSASLLVLQKSLKSSAYRTMKTFFKPVALNALYLSLIHILGGDIGETIINTHRPEFPNILIYGDSFTNPIETLLWTQANELRCVDFRYYTEKSLSDYILSYHPDIVICVRDETTYLTAEGNGITE